MQQIICKVFIITNLGQIINANKSQILLRNTYA